MNWNTMDFDNNRDWKTIIFILSAVLIAFLTMIEAYHDLQVIEHMTGSSEAWKFWGNVADLGAIIFTVAMIALWLESWYILIWIPILWFIHWTVHDCALGAWLADDWLYIGKGKFDQYMGRIFQQSGALYLGWKVLILFLMTGAYFSLDNK